MPEVKVTVKKATPVNIEAKKTELNLGVKAVVAHNHKHNDLLNLDYENAGHIGFQKQLTYDEDYKCYIAES